MVSAIPLAPKPDQSVIEALENLVEDAKAGRLQGFAVALHFTEQRTGNRWAGMGKANMAVIGELRALETDLLHMLVDLRHTEES